MFLSRKTLRSLQAVARRFPALKLGDVAEILNSVDLHAESRIFALHDRVVLLDNNRKIVARVKLHSLELERAVA